MSFLRRRNKNLAPQTQPETQETPVMAAVAGNLAVRLAARGPEVSKQDLEQNLAGLKAATAAAKSELRTSAPPERLTPPGSHAPLEDKLFHMADWSERLIIEDDHVLNPWQYARPGRTTDLMIYRKMRLKDKGLRLWAAAIRPDQS